MAVRQRKRRRPDAAFGIAAADPAHLTGKSARRHSAPKTRNCLFACSLNRLRSPTAEHIFAGISGINTLSAGTNRGAEEQLTADLVEWADLIFVMEQGHRRKVQSNHRASLNGKQVVVLNIPDDYKYMDPELIRELKVKMRPWSPLFEDGSIA